MKHLIFLFLLLPSVLLSQELETNYTLTESSATSAGVYDINNNLLRTLWSNVTQEAGVYNSPNWDGLDDFGEQVSSQGAYIKVISNNIQADWEGVIGNSSKDFSGEGVHARYDTPKDMLIIGDTGYFSHDYSERHGSVSGIDLNDYQHKIEVEEVLNVYPATTHLAYDGNMLYMAGRGGNAATQRYTFINASTLENLSPLFDYNINEHRWHPFGGDEIEIFSKSWPSADIIDSYPNEPRVTGLAVQTNGDNLFITREGLNSLRVVHKTTGDLRQELSYNAPKHAKVDENGNLWMVYDTATGTEVMEKFTVNATSGAITPADFTINYTFTNVQGVAFSPDGSVIAISDAAAIAHQVKGFSTTTGELLWTLGREENYITDPTVYNDKFIFKDNDDEFDQYGFLAYQDDGSLWVSDRGNERYIKFDTNRNYVDAIMWRQALYNVSVDANDPTRLFGDFLEYSIDYSKSLLPGNINNAWKLEKNWGAPELLIRYSSGDYNRLENVTTLSNGRTYGLLPNAEVDYAGEFFIVELVDGGVLRNTEVTIANRVNATELKPDGTFRWTLGESGVQSFYEQKITGFDADGNPQLGEVVVWDQYEEVGDYVKQDGPWTVSGETTSNENMVIFDGAVRVYDNTIGASVANPRTYHLAGWNKNTHSYSFRTAPAVVYGNEDSYARGSNTFDLRETVVFGGSVALAIDDWIIWGYNGEFWRAGQTNYWHMVSEEGLFLNDFGTDTSLWDYDVSPPGMAGNAFTPSLAKPEGSDDVYLYHGDESYHGGIHRWKISNLESVQKFNLEIDSSLSGDDVVLEAITIYPNPADEQISILGAKGGGYKLFGSSGKVYKAGSIDAQLETINTNALSKGIYFLKIIYEGKIKVEKIILE